MLIGVRHYCNAARELLRAEHVMLKTRIKLQTYSIWAIQTKCEQHTKSASYTSRAMDTNQFIDWISNGKLVQRRWDGPARVHVWV